MAKPKIVAEYANATTYLTIIDVDLNIILMCLPGLKGEHLEMILLSFKDELLQGLH